ncbi:hypothetical protein IWX50DRAFT_634959 [Phyllosticta citricarpa]
MHTIRAFSLLPTYLPSAVLHTPKLDSMSDVVVHSHSIQPPPTLPFEQGIYFHNASANPHTLPSPHTPTTSTLAAANLTSHHPSCPHPTKHPPPSPPTYLPTYLPLSSPPPPPPKHSVRLITPRRHLRRKAKTKSHHCTGNRHHTPPPPPHQWRVAPCES